MTENTGNLTWARKIIVETVNCMRQTLITKISERLTLVINGFYNKFFYRRSSCCIFCWNTSAMSTKLWGVLVYFVLFCFGHKLLWVLLRRTHMQNECYILTQKWVLHSHGLLFMLERSFICCYKICMTVPLIFRETGTLSSFFIDYYYDRDQFYWCFFLWIVL